MRTSIHSLRDLKQRRSPLYRAARGWVLSMNEKQDREEGPGFWIWIRRNLARPRPFDTFVLARGAEIVAMGSILPDDGRMGARHALHGIWLGGINVRRDLRGQGLGHEIVAVLLREADKRFPDEDIYLYTGNPIAVMLYKRHGFRALGDYQLRIGKRVAVMVRSSLSLVSSL